MSALPQVKALVFDVFGTVVDWRNGIARDARTFLARHGRGDIDPHRFADAWRKRYQPAMEEVRSGRRPFTRLDVLHRENLDGVLQDFGISTSGVSAEELEWLNRAWHRLDPWPDTIPGLIRLKAKHFIAPLSNGNILLLANMAKRAGMPDDVVAAANRVFRSIITSTEVKETVQRVQAAEVIASSPAEFAALLTRDHAKWTPVIREGNIRAE